MKTCYNLTALTDLPEPAVCAVCFYLNNRFDQDLKYDQKFKNEKGKLIR